MRRQKRVFPPNCTVCDLNPSRFLAFREKQDRVETEYGFRLGVPRRTPEQEAGHRRYMRDWQRRYRISHREEIKACRRAWFERRRDPERCEREAREARLRAEKEARRAQLEEKRRKAKEKRRRERELQKIRRANLAKLRKEQRELKRQREAAAKAAKREALRKQMAERKLRKAEQRKRLRELNEARRKASLEAKRQAETARRIEERERRKKAEAELAAAEREARKTYSAEREANRRAYLAAKESAKNAPVVTVAPVSSVPERPPINIADYLPTHPLRCLSLDETAPTDEEIAGEVAALGYADYASDDAADEPLVAGGGDTPVDPPPSDNVATGGSDDDDDDDWRRREREEKIRRIQEQYGFTLGKKPVTPEEIEGKKRYTADRNRETAIRNREIDYMLHHKERARKAAARKRLLTIARKKREEAAQAARKAKAAELAAQAKVREETRQVARVAKQEAKEAERRERAAFKAKARELRLPLQKARWTPEHQKIWDKAVQREARAKVEAERAVRREERKARQAIDSVSQAERLKAREEKRHAILEKYGFTLGKKPITPEEIEGYKRWQRDQEAEYRERHHDRITTYNREYRRRKRQEALEQAQKKWTPKQRAAFEKREAAKASPMGSPQWIVREVVKHLASEKGMPEDEVMGRIIDLGGLDFLVKGAESMGQQRCNRKSAVLAAVRALALYLDPDNAEMFGEQK